MVILGDYKTSNGSPVLPKEKGDRANFTGWSKLNKCGLQLGAYSIAVEETLGLHIDAAQILVSTPEIDQCFTFQGDELERFKTRWLQRVRKYRDLKEEEAAAEKEEKEVAA